MPGSPVCYVGDISYNGVTLTDVPIKSSISEVPIKADDGVAIKYFKVTINVEFIYTVPPTFSDVNSRNTADTYVETVRAALEERGKTLTYNYRGFGRVVGTTNEDLVYGPFPEVIECAPIGSNRSLKIIWRVTYAKLSCTKSSDPGNDTSARFQILQLTENTEVSFDEDGAAVITTSGTLEVASESGTNLNRENLKNFCKWFFPNNTQLKTFTRSSSISVRKDHRTIDYRVTDTEVKSDNPYYPYIVNQEVSHEVYSGIIGEPMSGAGYTSWTNDLNGTFRVRPGQWKGWAWVAYMHVMNQRMGRTSATTQATDRVVQNEDDSTLDGEAENATRKARKVLRRHQYPIFLRIKESIFGREVSLSSKWVTFHSLFDLFRATGLFYPVHNSFAGKSSISPPQMPDPLNDQGDATDTQWTLWKTNINSIQAIDGYRDPVLPDFSLIVDPCNYTASTLSTNHTSNYYDQAEVGSQGWIGYEASDDILPLGKPDYDNDASYTASTARYLRDLTPDTSWIAYRPNIKLMEQTNSTYVPSIEDYSIDELFASSGTGTELLATTRDQTGFRINGQTLLTTYSSLWANELIAIRGKPIYKVKFTGYAVRIGFQIPCPVITAVQAQSGTQHRVYRIGEQQWEHKTLNSSDEVPIFMAMWSQEYAVPANPQGGNIKFVTSGKQAEFA